MASYYNDILIKMAEFGPEMAPDLRMVLEGPNIIKLKLTLNLKRGRLFFYLPHSLQLSTKRRSRWY